jgi:hypothetical protein
VWAATVVVGFALLGPSRWRWGLVGEAVSYLGLGLGLVCWRPFRRLLAALPARGRRLPPAVLVLLLLGQLVGGSRLAFPLSRFSMYTDELSATEVSYAVEAVGAGGERVVVSDPSLFPSWRRDRFASLVERIAEDEVPGDGGCRGFPELARTVAELPEWQGRRPSRVELVATTYDFAHRHAEPPSATARTVVCTATVEP